MLCAQGSVYLHALGLLQYDPCCPPCPQLSISVHGFDTEVEEDEGFGLPYEGKTPPFFSECAVSGRFSIFPALDTNDPFQCTARQMYAGMHKFDHHFINPHLSKFLGVLILLS